MIRAARTTVVVECGNVTLLARPSVVRGAEMQITVLESGEIRGPVQQKSSRNL